MPEFLIWNYERGMYWRPGCMGYTSLKEEAGRYTFQQAIDICVEANSYSQNNPEEAMIPV